MTSPRTPSRPASALVEEHAILCRQLGGLQQRVSTLLTQHQVEIHRLDRETVHLRGQLLVARTALLWGLARAVVQPRSTGSADPSTRERTQTPTLPEARPVLCQVACVGHAHAWLDDHGQCTRDGQACDRLAD
jgi:hypothetical protein